MKTISLEELLEAGCHFGHQVTRQNPKARDFVFESRDNIHIIDLVKTKEGLESATEFVKSLGSKAGTTLLVVGTKRQAQGIVLDEIKKANEQLGETGSGLYHITNRWIGGILTNFSEVSKNFKKLKDIADRLQNEEEKAKYTKKEIGGWEKERVKLQSFYGGVYTMDRIPDALFIIDTHLEDLAVREGYKTNVPVVGIVDTNADPTNIVYPIPANDDAVGSIKLIVNYVIDAWIEGRKQGEKNQEKAENQEKKTPKKEKSAKEKTEEQKEASPKTEEKPKAKKTKTTKEEKKE